MIQSQRFRDQARNIEDCRDKLREMVLRVCIRRGREVTRPSRASGERRLAAKKQQAQRKSRRRKPSGDD